MWGLTLLAQLWRVFEIWKSNVQAPHLFLPVCCSVREGYCNIGCETTTPTQQRHLQDMNESTQRDRGIVNLCNPTGSTKQSANKINVTDYFTLLVKIRTFIQSRWQLCKEKEDVLWQPKKNFLCAKHLQWKKKKRNMQLTSHLLSKSSLRSGICLMSKSQFSKGHLTTGKDEILLKMTPSAAPTTAILSAALKGRDRLNHKENIIIFIIIILITKTNS